MGNMVPWEPFREMTSLREAMSRLFEESFLRPGAFGSSQEGGLSTPVDIYETDDSVVFKAAVPGVKPEDLDVSVTGDVLTIKGEYKEEQETQQKRNYIRQEHRYGSFSRTLTLPTTVDVNKAKATFDNGILTLEMPKMEAVKPKSVRITAK